MADRIWSGTRALADRTRRGPAGVAGHRRTRGAGRVIAARLGLTGAMGTVAEIRDGAYTGRLVGEMMHGPAKAKPSGARRRGRLGPGPVHGVQRLDQGRADTDQGRPRGRRRSDSALRRAAQGQGLGRAATSAPGQAAKVAVPVALGAA